MTFPQQPEVTRTPTRIRRLEIRLYKSVDVDDSEYPRGIEYRFTVDDQHDRAMNHFRGDASPHLGNTPIDIPAGTSWLTVAQGFFDQAWTKAENEAIP